MDVSFFFFPCSILTESPRWLISRGKYQKAEKILKKVADVNKTSLPNPLFEEGEVTKHKVMQKRFMFSISIQICDSTYRKVPQVSTEQKEQPFTNVENSKK